MGLSILSSNLSVVFSQELLPLVKKLGTVTYSTVNFNVQEESFGVKIGGDLFVHSDGDLFKRKLVV